MWPKVRKKNQRVGFGAGCVLAIISFPLPNISHTFGHRLT